MKLNLILTDSAGWRMVLERVHGFLEPLRKSLERVTCCCIAGKRNKPDAVKCWLEALKQYGINVELDCIQADEEASPEELGDFVREYLRMHQAELTVFYGSHLGTYLGKTAAACGGGACFPQAISIQAKSSDVFWIQRKVYDAHIDAFFPWNRSENPAIIILSEHGRTEKYACSDTPVLMEHWLDWKLTKDVRIISKMRKEQADDLAWARLVFIGGMGLGKKENFKWLEKLAKRAGASCGCTRAAAISGWTDFSKVVGVSGKSLHAETSVLFGVSGAGPFLYGTEEVKRLVAVNTNRNAPVFQAAHMGIVCDCVEISKGTGSIV